MRLFSPVAYMLVPLLLVGCAPSQPRSSTEPAKASRESTAPAADGVLDSQGNVVLYVSNQSLPKSLVDISVEIDGESVVSDEFSTGTGHNRTAYVLRLAPGSHVITARSAKGDATLRRAFTVTGKHWMLLDYWYEKAEDGTRGFVWRIDDKAMGFD